MNYSRSQSSCEANFKAFCDNQQWSSESGPGLLRDENLSGLDPERFLICGPGTLAGTYLAARGLTSRRRSQQPCATAAESPRLAKWIELSGSESPSFGWRLHIPILPDQADSRSGGGMQPARSTQSRIAENDCENAGVRIPRTLEKYFRTVRGGARHKPPEFPAVYPSWFNLLRWLFPVCATGSHLQWPIPAPTYGKQALLCGFPWGTYGGAHCPTAEPFPTNPGKYLP